VAGLRESDDSGVAAAERWVADHGSPAPTPSAVATWAAAGRGRAPDCCPTEPAACCGHGLASWWPVLVARRHRAQAAGPPAAWDPGLLLPHPERLALDDPAAAAALAAHEAAVDAGEAGYLDPSTALFVLTARWLWERGTCCGRGCRHCPWVS